MADVDLCSDIVIPDTTALIRAARDRASELCSRPADWDGPGGSAISPVSPANAVRLVAGVTCPECLRASLSPTSAGNILPDWTLGDDHVEVEIIPDGRFDVLVRVAGPDWEGSPRIEGHDHLGWLGHHVSRVGIERFQVPAATA